MVQVVFSMLSNVYCAAERHIEEETGTWPLLSLDNRAELWMWPNDCNQKDCTTDYYLDKLFNSII